MKKTGKIVLVSVLCAAVAVSSFFMFKKDKSGSTKVTLSEAASELKDYKFKKHDNLTFSCKPIPIECDKLYKLKLQVATTERYTEKDKNDFKNLLKSGVNFVEDESAFNTINLLFGPNEIVEFIEDNLGLLFRLFGAAHNDVERFA